jgi:hypothetical protein
VVTDQPGEILPGDIYEDCAFHPVLCTAADGDELSGISLIDASMPRSCSLSHCGVIKLSILDVIAARKDWPTYLSQRKSEWALPEASADEPDHPRQDRTGQPGLDEIEALFVALLDTRVSRDEADRWAADWVRDDSLVWDDLSWWALNLLHGIDLQAGSGDSYLHDDGQVREWLTELRRRRAT